MSREFMCEYGNCNETDVKVTVTDKVLNERVRFCCEEHAGLYLLRRSWMIEGQRDKATADRLANTLANDLKH